MPARIFKTATATAQNWVPSNDGITNSTVIRIHAVGSGGRGGDGDISGGGGGGSAERVAAEHTVADASLTYTYYVPAVNEESTAYLRDPDNITDIAAAINGENSTELTGGLAGGGGTGSLYVRAGANGGDGHTDSGGGGAAAATDASAGVAGANGSGSTGGTGGSGGTQLGVASAAEGGNGGSSGQDGVLGDTYGSGGGGGALTKVGANGRPAIIIVVWGEMLTTYPPASFVDGFVPDSAAGNKAWWNLLI